MNRSALSVAVLLAALATIVALTRSADLTDTGLETGGSAERAPAAQAAPATEAATATRLSRPALATHPETDGASSEATRPWHEPPAASPTSAADSVSAADPTLAETPDERKHLLFARTHHIAKKLGWNVTGDDAFFLAKWETDKRQLDRLWIQKIHDSGEPTEMKAFNEKVATLRSRLIARLGLSSAHVVLRSCALYSFALPGGRWQRIDAQGSRIPFVSEDEDVFANADWRR